MIHSNIVVGSGPAGVATAVALLSRGQTVLMVDAGKEIEIQKQKVLKKISESFHERVPRDLLDELKGQEKVDERGFPIKLSHGSDYPYAGVNNLLKVQSKNCDLKASFAKGGLSNVWGAAMLPYSQKDLKDWPITRENLESHYRAVANFVGVLGKFDNLESEFPFFSRPSACLRQHPQTEALLSDLDKSQDHLIRAGIQFGRARLAIVPPFENKAFGCTYCGLCLAGCPHDLIYSSRHTLDNLLKNPNFSYLPHRVLHRFEEKNTHVVLFLKDLMNGDSHVLDGHRIFLGCGTLPTTAITMNSLEIYHQALVLYDSQYFVAPFLRFKGVKEWNSQDSTSLSQLFFEITDPSVTNYFVHMQIYGCSDYLVNAFKSKLKGLLYPGRWVLPPILSHLLTVQGFLHSEDSGRIEIVLSRPTVEGELKLDLTGKTFPGSKAKIRKIFSKLNQEKSRLGGVLISPLADIPLPGRSFHVGGSFPMKINPTDLQSDLLGRPKGLKRVHLVDSSVFPSIPATTITFSVMANAHRIGWEASQI